MKNFSFNFMIACFLFSTIFIAAGCANTSSVVPPPLSAADKKVEETKPKVEEAAAGFTYEEVTAWRYFFLREQLR